MRQTTPIVVVFTPLALGAAILAVGNPKAGETGGNQFRRIASTLCMSIIACLLLAVAANAQRRPTKVETIAAVGDKPLDIEYFLHDHIYDGYLFWHQSDEIATIA